MKHMRVNVILSVTIFLCLKMLGVIIFANRVLIICSYMFQARSILLLANREMEERLRTPTGSEPSSPNLQSYSPTTGLSMKRSLQRFLQKRKCRIQATSPYNH